MDDTVNDTMDDTVNDTIFDEEVAPKYISCVKADTASLPVRVTCERGEGV